MTIAKEYPHCHWVRGRSLIRTFLAGATKDAAVYEMSDEQAQKKKCEQIWLFQKNCLPLHPMMSHKMAAGLVSGVL